MAYQTGTVNSLEDIQTVIQAFLTAHGWAWDSDESVVYKDDVFVRFVTPTAEKALFRATTALTGGTDAANSVGFGRLSNVLPAGQDLGLLSFPATYYAFLNDDEFYFVVNYSVTRFQYVMWGASTIDTGGSGAYISGSTTNTVHASVNATATGGISIGPSGGLATQYQYGNRSAAPFFDRSNTISASVDLRSSFVHSASGWALGVVLSLYHTGVGNNYAGNLQAVLPNAWNGEAPLLPLRAYQRVAESKASLVVDLQHARQCRVDNFNDTEVISLGADQWMVFPFHRKNITARDGGHLVDHTGTLGWAIRKVV